MIKSIGWCCLSTQIRTETCRVVCSFIWEQASIWSFRYLSFRQPYLSYLQIALWWKTFAHLAPQGFQLIFKVLNFFNGIILLLVTLWMCLDGSSPVMELQRWSSGSGRFGTSLQDMHLWWTDNSWHVLEREKIAKMWKWWATLTNVNMHDYTTTKTTTDLGP